MDAILSAVFGFCFCCCFCCLWCQRLKGHRVGDSGCPKCPLPCKGFWAASKLSVCALTRKPAADTSLSFVLVSSLKRVVVYVIVNSVSLGTGFQFPLWKGVCRVIYTHCSVTFTQIVLSKGVLQAGSIDSLTLQLCSQTVPVFGDCGDTLYLCSLTYCSQSCETNHFGISLPGQLED